MKEAYSKPSLTTLNHVKHFISPSLWETLASIASRTGYRKRRVREALATLLAQKEIDVKQIPHGKGYFTYKARLGTGIWTPLRGVHPHNNRMKAKTAPLTSENPFNKQVGILNIHGNISAKEIAEFNKEFAKAVKKAPPSFQLQGSLTDKIEDCNRQITYWQDQCTRFRHAQAEIEAQALKSPVVQDAIAKAKEEGRQEALKELIEKERLENEVLKDAKLPHWRSERYKAAEAILKSSNTTVEKDQNLADLKAALRQSDPPAQHDDRIQAEAYAHPDSFGGSDF